jgi:hypothetical protein
MVRGRVIGNDQLEQFTDSPNELTMKGVWGIKGPQEAGARG